MIDKEIEAELEKCYTYGNLNKDKVKELIKRMTKEEYDKGYKKGYEDRNYNR